MWSSQPSLDDTDKQNSTGKYKSKKKVSGGTNAVFHLPAEFYSKPADIGLIVLQQISYHRNCHSQSL